MKLFYREYGNGVPLVILHGLYGSSDNWISIAKILAKRFRVILPDQRNHGASLHDSDHNYSSMSTDLNDLVEDLNLGSFFLAGHSMGGKTAMWYAAAHPEKISGLMVIDISPFSSNIEDGVISNFHIKVLNELTNLPLSTIKSREEADNILARSISSSKIRKFLLKNLTRDEDKNFIWKLNPGNIEDNLSKILDGFKRENLSDNQISGFPVIFARAGESGYIPQSDFNDISLLFPSAEIITINNSSHWVHAEQPEAVIELFWRLIE